MRCVLRRRADPRMWILLRTETMICLLMIGCLVRERVRGWAFRASLAWAPAWDAGGCNAAALPPCRAVSAAVHSRALPVCCWSGFSLLMPLCG